jgi:hypothetical protein
MSRPHPTALNPMQTKGKACQLSPHLERRVDGLEVLEGENGIRIQHILEALPPRAVVFGQDDGTGRSLEVQAHQILRALRRALEEVQPGEDGEALPLRDMRITRAWGSLTMVRA